MSQDDFDTLLQQLADARAEDGAVFVDPEGGVYTQPIERGPPLGIVARPVSKDAIALIIAGEISSPAYYASRLTHPVWPHGASGVTIGIGYDIGTVKPVQFHQDWAGELGGHDIEALTEACGVRGQAAEALVGGLHGITVGYDHANRVFTLHSLPHFTAHTQQTLPNSDRLSPDCLGALVSLAYNRGPAFKAPGDRYREVRNIHDHMQAAAFDKIPAELRAMKHLWPGHDQRGLVLRREAEAVLFARGLAGCQASPGA
jgi:hypothetical protein